MFSLDEFRDVEFLALRDGAFGTQVLEDPLDTSLRPPELRFEDIEADAFLERALGRRQSADSVAALEKVIAKEQFNHVRIAALDSLGQIGGGRVAGIAAGLVRDDDPDVAHAAQVALGKSGQRE